MRLVNHLMARTFAGKPVDLRNRRVRLVYTDEAGISNPVHEPFMVVASIILNADQDWMAIDRHLKSIMRKRLPEDLRFTGVFHAKDLWHGTKNFHRDEWSLQERMQILGDLSEIPKKFHLTVVHGFVERMSAQAFLAKRYPDTTPLSRATLIHASAFASVAGAVDRWMRHHASNEVAMIVAEDAGKIKSAIKDIQDGYRQDSVDEYFNYFEDKGVKNNLFKTKQIIDTVHFASKKASPLLQVADTCAFLIKRQLQGCEDSKPQFESIKGQMFLPLQANGWPERSA